MTPRFQIGSEVRLVRRPFFTGEVVGVQLPLFEGGGGCFCRWTFKPDDWEPKTAIPDSELEAISSEAGSKRSEA